jgi:hypothetical protein
MGRARGARWRRSAALAHALRAPFYRFRRAVCGGSAGAGIFKNGGRARWRHDELIGASVGHLALSSIPRQVSNISGFPDRDCQLALVAASELRML